MIAVDNFPHFDNLIFAKILDADSAIDTGLLSFLLVIWFAITFVGPELGWGEAVQRLTPFYYYGRPLIEGWQFWNMLGVLAVAGAALVLASMRFMRKDIGR